MKLIGVTAPFTGSGKTLVTLALLARLPDSISFKIGPDFLDSQIHSSVSGTRSPSIDRWLQGTSYRKIPCYYGEGYSTGVVEGVMGLYDSGAEKDVSTHYYFSRLGIPYILVINVWNMAESAYNIARGFLGKGCIGVIVNNYYSGAHLEMIRRKFEEKGVKVIGAIPHSNDLTLPERHLGLDSSVNPDKIREVAGYAGSFIDTSFMENVPDYTCDNIDPPPASKGRKSIWIAYDNAFNFYYQTSISALERMGEIRYFSPLRDEVPEEPDLIYIGGGYPELYAKRLAENRKTISGLRDASESGVPILAECGGLMYLEDRIETENGPRNLAGIFPGIVKANSRLTLGYTRMRASKTSILFRKGEVAYGHEFHYSSIEDPSEKVLCNLIGRGIDGMDGIQVRKTFGSYSHFDLERYSRRIERILGM